MYVCVHDRDGQARAQPARHRLGIDHRPRKGDRGHRSVRLGPWAHTVFGNLKTWLRETFHGVSRLDQGAPDRALLGRTHFAIGA